MGAKLWIVLILLGVASTFIVQCAPEEEKAGVPEPTVDSRQESSFCRDSDPVYCEAHSDCICQEDRGCFLGNREYYEKCEDKEYGCPDFCGQAPPVACIDNQCTQNYPQKEWDWTFADCENKVPETETTRCQAIVAWSVAKDDLEQALKKCETLGGNFQGVCYLSVAQSIAVENIEQAEEICDQEIDKINSDFCYSEIARLVSSLDEVALEKAISLCGKIERQETKDECYQRMIRDIVTFKSEQYALDFCQTKVKDSAQRDYCFTTIASTTADPSICEKVVTDYQKRNCVSRIYEGIIRDIVESKSEQHALDFCNTDVEDSLQRDICFTEIARISTDPSTCEKVADDDLKRSCEQYIELNRESSD